MNDLSARIITPSCEKLGWEGYYGLRRGFGTILVEHGATLIQVAKALGNTVAVTESSYFVDDGTVAAAAADQYERSIRGKTGGSEGGRLTGRRTLGAGVGND